MNGRDGTTSTDISNNSIDETTTTNTLVRNNSLDKIRQNLQVLPGNPMELEKFTIFRVPAHIRQKNKELYEPKMISIGPYYNGNKAFQAMETHKLRYLRDYLSRNTRNSFDHCVNELSKLESRARKCYFEESNLKSDQFLKMMLLDGCFIIEFLIKWYSGVSVPVLDSIFDVGWVLPIIRSDLLLLENQIPFFVIQKLFDLLTSSNPVPAQEITSSHLVPFQEITSSHPISAEEITSSHPVLAQEITSSHPGIAPLGQMLLAYLSRPRFNIPVEIKHILHLYHLCYMPIPTKVSTKTYDIQRRFPRTIPSATELKEAGVTFKCNESKNILDIKFQNGTLEIPFISIEETHRSRLLNLVSFEQCYSQLDMDLTSYACFMGSLFKNARDVTLLQKMGIVDNLLATNNELVSFFNWLTECSYLDYDRHYLKELVIDVNRYYISDWPRWRATLMRNYFSNPWSIISSIAAFSILAFTGLQTFYTIISYYYRQH